MVKTNKNRDELKRPPYGKNLVISLILATIVFVGIFYVGYGVSYVKYQNILQSQERIRYDLLSFDVEKSFIGEDCSAFNPYLFSEEMDNMGKVIGILEDRLGKLNSDVLNQKKTYALLEARHFLYIKEHNLKCNNSIPVIFLFYSNYGAYKEEAERLGFMLSTIKQSSSEVLIYSFDYDLDSSLINLLKEKYNVVKPNTLVINEKTFLNVFEDVEDIKRILG